MFLSDRSITFLRSCYVSSAMVEGRKTSDAIETTVEAAENAIVGGALRGLVFPIHGGDLRGWCRVGALKPVMMRASNGPSIIKVAEHNDAQCAIVMAIDGRIGVSWSGEFLPRYSHMTHMIESAAVWSMLLGWYHADAVRSEPEKVLRFLPRSRLIAEASGEHIRWWLGEDCVIYSETQLTAGPGTLPTVVVLAQDDKQATGLGDYLQSRVEGVRPHYFLRTMREIGVAPSDPPIAWGGFLPAREIFDALLNP